MEESEWYDMMPKPWECHTPDAGLSYTMKNHDYDGFIKILSFKIRQTNASKNITVEIKCEGECPNGCPKKFKLKRSKSITKRSFERMFLHCLKYPNHCLTTKFQGDIVNGNIL